MSKIAWRMWYISNDYSLVLTGFKVTRIFDAFTHTHLHLHTHLTASSTSSQFQCATVWYDPMVSTNYGMLRNASEVKPFV